MWPQAGPLTSEPFVLIRDMKHWCRETEAHAGPHGYGKAVGVEKLTLQTPTPEHAQDRGGWRPGPGHPLQPIWLYLQSPGRACSAYLIPALTVPPPFPHLVGSGRRGGGCREGRAHHTHTHTHTHKHTHCLPPVRHTYRGRPAGHTSRKSHGAPLPTTCMCVHACAHANVHTRTCALICAHTCMHARTCTGCPGCLWGSPLCPLTIRPAVL